MYDLTNISASSVFDPIESDNVYVVGLILCCICRMSRKTKNQSQHIMGFTCLFLSFLGVLWMGTRNLCTLFSRILFTLRLILSELIYSQAHSASYSCNPLQNSKGVRMCYCCISYRSYQILGSTQIRTFPYFWLSTNYSI